MVHIYTGDGKGKTTAAFGLALRAAGAGLKVCIFQFIKGPDQCESAILSKAKNIKFEQCGRGLFIKGKAAGKDIDYAKKGLCDIQKRIKTGKYDMIILDEVNVALHKGLISTAEIIAMINDKPDSVELVLTGRYCPKSLYKYADLVTEMRNIKHPFDKGIKARLGIEY